jgi:predicted GTPase
MVLTTGDKSEMIGAMRETWVKGDDTLRVDGAQSITVKGAHSLKAKTVSSVAEGTNVVDGKAVHLGDPNATEPALLGNVMAQWVATAQVLTAMGPAPFAPPTIQAFQTTLSKKVMVK